MSPVDKPHHILLSCSPPGSPVNSQRDLDPGFWKSPVDIDDADLTFDGKPLNLLHEENQNRWMVENHVFERAEDHARGRGKKGEERRREVRNPFPLSLLAIPPWGFDGPFFVNHDFTDM
jgi:hypothetical protein